MTRAAGWLVKVATTLLLVLVLAMVAARFVPVPSTLMLGRWLSGAPVERVWVPLERISPHLVQALIASEDQRFCAHWGVDFAALREVLAEDDGPSRGASTLTMQVVKNLYLWPGRSYLRKAMELPLALVSERVWGKRRTLEIYFNVAEWGEGLFGAEAAARRYYNRPAAELGPTEAARLVAALPNPFLRAADRPSAASRRVRQRMPGVTPLLGCLE